MNDGQITDTSAESNLRTYLSYRDVTNYSQCERIKYCNDKDCFICVTELFLDAHVLKCASFKNGHH